MIKSQIEKNALKIWQFLDNNQLSSVFEIEKGLSMQRQDVLLALGWLAREDKIYFPDDKRRVNITEDMYGDSFKINKKRPINQ